MIKANELRIGNLLSDVEDRICRVERIYEDDWAAYAIKGAVTTGTPYPIPISEEILLKVGFEKGLVNTMINAYCLFSFYLTIYEDKLFYEWKGGNIEVKHLHQLQNLYFALTGQELNTSGLINTNKR